MPFPIYSSLGLTAPLIPWKGHSTSPLCFLLRPKIPMSGQLPKSVFSSVIAIRRTCPWGSVFLMDVASGTDHLYILHQCESLTSLLFGIITSTTAYMNLHKTWLQKLLLFCLFTQKSPFWFMCITTILSILNAGSTVQLWLQFFPCWSVCDMMQHLWNVHPLITQSSLKQNPACLNSSTAWEEGRECKFFLI